MLKTSTTPETKKSPLSGSKIEQLFIAITICYTASFFISQDLFKLTQALILIGLFLLLTVSKNGITKTIKSDPLLKISLLILAFLAMARIWYTFTLPEQIHPKFKITQAYLNPLIIFSISVAICHMKKLGQIVILCISATSFLTYLLLFTETGEWLSAFQGKRVDFGLQNAQHASMFFATTAMSLLIFLPRIIATRFPGKFMKIAALIGYSALLTLSLFGVLTTQTRAIWIGFSAGAVISLTVFLIAERHRLPQIINKTSITITILLTTTILCLALFIPTERVIEERVSSENIEIQKSLDIELHNANPKTSSSVRLAFWKAAAIWISERPLLGWGPGSVRTMIDQSDFFSDRIKKRFGHLHNSYIESLVANGVIGTIIYGAAMLWIAFSGLISWKRKVMPTDFFIFTIGFFTLWAIANMFESYIIFGSGRYLSAIILGVIYSFYLKSKTTSCPETSTARPLP